MRQQYEQESLLGGLFNEKDNKMGMRLERMEIYNWGAYDGYSAIPLARYSALISGDSGSGKSTILDAMVTLLRPPKITYNRAAEQSSMPSTRIRQEGKKMPASVTTMVQEALSLRSFRIPLVMW